MKFNGKTYNISKAEQTANQMYDVEQQRRSEQQSYQPQKQYSQQELVDLAKKVNKVNPVGYISQEEVEYFAKMAQMNNIQFDREQYISQHAQPINNSYPSPNNYNQSSPYNNYNQSPLYNTYNQSVQNNRETKHKFKISESPIPRFIVVIILCFTFTVLPAMLVTHLKETSENSITQTQESSEKLTDSSQKDSKTSPEECGIIILSTLFTIAAVVFMHFDKANDDFEIM